MTTQKIESIIEARVFGLVLDPAATKVPAVETGAMVIHGRKPITIREKKAVCRASPSEMALMVESGMPGAYLKRLSEGIPRDILAATVGTGPSNFSKLYHRKLSKLQTDEINDLTLLWEELRTFFEEDAELLEEWLESPVPALSGAKPVDLLSTIVGRRAIRRCLESMRYGEFA